MQSAIPKQIQSREHPTFKEVARCYSANSDRVTCLGGAVPIISEANRLSQCVGQAFYREGFRHSGNAFAMWLSAVVRHFAVAVSRVMEVHPVQFRLPSVFCP